MYGRRYGGRELHFEASGGLLHSALVMRDDESDSYWSIMTGTAIAGELEGTRLEELPVGEKAQWKDWVRRHPDTRVLSVGGVEHVENNPYDNYLASDSGFRRMKAQDRRLPTKEPIYTFRHGERPIAVPFSAFEGGAAFDAEGLSIFLYRPRGVAVYDSTAAFRSPTGFERRDGVWTDTASGARFDPLRRRFEGGEGDLPQPLQGFDTFWYTWSLTNPGTILLTGR